MDRKYKLLVASSLVSVIATGCSSYGTRGNADPQTNVTGAGGYTSQQAATATVSDNTVQQTTNSNGRTQQWYIDQYNRNKAAGTNNGRTQQWYIDQYNREQAAKNNKATTAPNGRTQQWYIDQYNRNKASGTNNGRTQQWYIDQYNREQAAKKAKANTTTNGRTQQWYIDQYNRQQAAAKQQQQTQQVASNGRTKQWYIDRFNRQQAAKAAAPAYVPPKPVVVTKPYVAPAYVPPKPIVYNAPKSYVAPAPATKTQTQYVDYTGGVAATATTPTNKNLYTGSYQQPNTTYQQYTPKTYTGGANSGNAVSTAAASGAGTYIVKKGDTVFEVMRQTGVYWKEIISMNNLQAPSYTIQPGQALRLR
jgi:hypothetical protein